LQILCQLDYEEDCYPGPKPEIFIGKRKFFNKDIRGGPYLHSAVRGEFELSWFGENRHFQLRLRIKNISFIITAHRITYITIVLAYRQGCGSGSALI
jgi:hypothetical protein